MKKLWQAIFAVGISICLGGLLWFNPINLFQDDKQVLQPKNAQLAQLEVAIADTVEKYNVGVIEAVRIFSRENSFHGANTDEFKGYDNAIIRLLDTYNNDAPKLSIWCGQIVATMATILQMMDYKFTYIRLGAVLNGAVITDHVVLNVFNKKSQLYELHDADYNIHYIDKKSGTRLSATALMAQKDIATGAAPERKGVASWKLPVPPSIKEFVCSGNCSTIENTLLIGGFYTGLEFQGGGKVLFNESMLSRYPKKRQEFMDWFIKWSRPHPDSIEILGNTGVGIDGA